MKIGIYCTNNTVYPVPAGKIYASMSLAGEMADEMTRMGEEVIMFAPEGTKTTAKLVTFGMKPFDDKEVYTRFTDKDASYQYENIMMLQILNYIEKEQFDIFQTHCRPFSVLDFAPLKPGIPIVVTVHDPVSYPGYKILPEYNRFTNIHLVSISQAQRKGQADVNWAANIYDGVNLGKWTFKNTQGGYLAFVGRMMAEKGADTAVQVALKTGNKLKMAGSIYDDDREFFESKIKPFLGEQIQYLGALPREQLPELYGGAQALLVPIRWEEPFGLVMIEAMACGTPVIAFNHGSVPEIVEDGRSGFIVHSPEEMSEKVKEVKQIKRFDCRRRVEDNFSIKIMTRKYIEMYRDLVGVKY